MSDRAKIDQLFEGVKPYVDDGTELKIGINELAKETARLWNELPKCEMLKSNGRKCGMPARFERQGVMVCRSHYHAMKDAEALAKWRFKQAGVAS